MGDVEQEISPRVTGTILWMPFYAGDRVRNGQLLAKLDSRDYLSGLNEGPANRDMAEQTTAISRLGYQQALSSAAQGRAEARSKEGALEESRRMHSRAQAVYCLRSFIHRPPTSAQQTAQDITGSPCNS